MNDNKIFSARGLAIGVVLAVVVMGFRMPSAQERLVPQSHSRPVRALFTPAAIAPIPAVKDGTHYEIPLARVEARDF